MFTRVAVARGAKTLGMESRRSAKRSRQSQTHSRPAEKSWNNGLRGADGGRTTHGAENGRPLDAEPAVISYSMVNAVMFMTAAPHSDPIFIRLVKEFFRRFTSRRRTLCVCFSFFSLLSLRLSARSTLPFARPLTRPLRNRPKRKFITLFFVSFALFVSAVVASHDYIFACCYFRR